MRRSTPSCRTGFRRSSAAPCFLKVSREVGANDDETFEAAIGWLEGIRDANAVVLDKLTKWYVASAIALGVEVLMWSLALAT